MSQIREWSRLKRIGDSKYQEAFIGCANYEERCQGAIDAADADYRADHFIVMCRAEHLGIGKTKENFDSMLSKADRLCRARPVPLMFELDNPVGFLGTFRTEISKTLLPERLTKMTVDMSTMPRQQLFIVLRELRHQIEPCNLRLLYAEPAGYSTEKPGGWLTRGVRSVSPLLGFGGIQDPILRKLLIILSGHEGERAHIIWRRHQPDKTILIGQGLPYHKGLNDIAERENSLLSTMLGDVCVYDYRPPAREVDGVYLELEKLYSRYAHEYNFVVACTGTKLQALGMYLFAESRPDVQVTYAVPIEYNWKDYSWGLGKMWEINELNPYESDE